MKVIQIINDNLDGEYANTDERFCGTVNNREKEESLPFLNIDLDNKKGLTNITKKVENVNKFINSQTDKLLIEGFDGSEEDFKKCYHKIKSVNFKKASDIKHKRINNNFLKDGYRTIRLTKTKEFNLSGKGKTNKLLEHLKINKHFKFSSNKNIKTLKKRNYLFNSLFSDNNIHRTNYLSSSNSNADIFLNNQSCNLYMNILDKNDSNSINRNYGNTFYFYKKNKNTHNNKLKDIKNHLGILKQFTTMRNILNDASHNIININVNLKKYLENDNLHFTGNHSKNKKKSNKFLKTNDKADNKIKDLLDIFKKKKKYDTLKLVKNDDGINSHDIWMRRPIANLISFGKSFINLDDYHFHRERKRIMEDYPKLEKEADISVDGVEKKDNENPLIKIKKIKLAKNSQKMKDLNYINHFMLKKIKERIKLINKK